MKDQSIMQIQLLFYHQQFMEKIRISV